MGYDINKLLDDLPALMLQHNAQKEQARQFNADLALREKAETRAQGAENRAQDAYNIGKQEKMSLSDLIKTDVHDSAKQRRYYQLMEKPENRQRAIKKIYDDASFKDRWKLFFSNKDKKHSFYNQYIESQAPERLYPNFSKDTLYSPQYSDYFNANMADQYATQDDKLNLLHMMQGGNR